MTAAQLNRLGQLVAWYQSLTRDAVARVPEFYSPGARFRDPFNDVKGTVAIERVLRHMFVQVKEPRFEVSTVLHGQGQACLVWDFHFHLGTRHCTVRGNSILRFDEDALIVEHLDYWDSASQLFVHLPVVGAITRVLLRRLSASRG